MTKELALAATLVAGGLVAVQAPVNAMLGGSIGTFGAASVNFAVGTAILLVITFLVGGGLESNGGSVPWYTWVLGGLAGAAYVTVALVAVRSLGAGGVTAATIAGQLAVSVVADRMGILGLETRAITVEKLIGIGLLAIGTLLVVRD